MKKIMTILMIGSSMKNEAQIKFDKVFKEYIPLVGVGIRRPKLRRTLKDISFTINKGERVGLIGSNGAGKTSLLKIIAGISRATKGSVVVSGKVNSLMELGAGFNQDLTGRENIMLNGMLAGTSKEKVRNSMEEIINTSGIREYIDYPFYTYSAGMKLRLAFSVATHASPDILLFDEIVAMGDEQFIKLFSDYFLKVIEEKRTVLFATHVLDILPLYCERVIWMEDGVIKMDGPTIRVIKEYRRSQKKAK